MTTTAKMPNAEAADILRTLRHTCGHASGKTADAIDKAIEVLERERILPTIDSIAEAVAEETGISVDTMRSKNRLRENTEARAMVSWMAYHYCKMSLVSIGNYFDRTHAMSVHYNHMVDEWVYRPTLNRRCAEIINRLIERIEDK